MDKAEHGLRLKMAMAQKRYDRKVIADATGQKVRTVTNWTGGVTMPDARIREILRKLLGEYDIPGDQVEAALRRSDLDEWRQDTVIAFYKRNLHEQRHESAS